MAEPTGVFMQKYRNICKALLIFIACIFKSSDFLMYDRLRLSDMFYAY